MPTKFRQYLPACTLLLCTSLFSTTLLTACNTDSTSSAEPSRTQPLENRTLLSAGENSTLAEGSMLELTAQVQPASGLSVKAYSWFPASENTVFFGEAGRSDESMLRLQLPQVDVNRTVEFVLQVQMSDNSMVEDLVQVEILNTLNNALPNVVTNAQAVGTDNRLVASACESTDADGNITQFMWRNETVNLRYEESGCNLNVMLPSSPDSRTYTLRSIAIDNQQGLGFKLFDATTPARAANSAPVIQSATALPEPVRPGETLVLQANATDADNDMLFYRWVQTQGAVLTLRNSDKATAQADIPAGFTDQNLVFKLEVSDRTDFNNSVASRTVNAAVRANQQRVASPLACLQNPTLAGCPLAGLLSAPPLALQQAPEGSVSAGQCNPFFGAGLKGEGYSHLIGAMHEHTAYSDGQANTDPLQVYQQTRARNLDFVMSSDHSDNLAVPLALPDTANCTDNPLSCLISDPNNPVNSLTKWQTTQRQAQQVTSESNGRFTAMRGFEWTSDRFGHANVYLSRNNINAKAGPGYVVSMDLFWQWFLLSPQLGGGGDGLMVFNHPGREDALHSVLLQIGEGVGQATRMASALNALNVFQQGDPAYAFNDFKYVAPADYRVVGLEVFGKGDEYDTDGKFGSWYGHALDKGWYLGPVGSEDHHATDWGGASLPKTVLISRSNNEADIREAFLARRFYTVAQNENQLRLQFNARQGQQHLPMGSRIGTRQASMLLEFEIRSTNPMDKLENMTVELFSSQAGPGSNTAGRYQPLQVKKGTAGQFQVSPTEGKNWYFIRVKRGERIVSVSAPIWMFMGSNPLPECPL